METSLVYQAGHTFTNQVTASSPSPHLPCHLLLSVLELFFAF